MPRMTWAETTIAAGAEYNAAEGWEYEYLPWRAVVRILTRAVAAGAVLDVKCGSESIVSRDPIDAGLTVSELPCAFNVEPLVFVAPAGDRIRVAVTNTTAGAIAGHSGIVDVNPA